MGQLMTQSGHRGRAGGPLHLTIYWIYRGSTANLRCVLMMRMLILGYDRRQSVQTPKGASVDHTWIFA